MSSFEYVMIIVSIILGLAITTLLRGAVRALRADTKTTPGLLHSVWAIVLLITMIYLWSLRWSGAERTEWPFGVLLAFLFMPILYYALSELLFPPEGVEVNLTEYFLDNRRVFFGLMILTQIAGAIGPSVFYDGYRLPGLGLAWQLGPIPFSLFFAWSRNERLHIGWAMVTLLRLLWRAGFASVG